DFLPGVGIPVLAIIVVITTYFQSKLMTPATQTSDQPSPTAGLTYMMPLMMGYISYIYSAGLALYFLTGNVISIIQFAATGRLNLSNLLPGNKKNAKT
ncbi:MAG: YidC/Oxa1 family membrane protein insertase, partial [Chloroflexi bacterium]|nr:YidC/Oxa1 family membrane protein insertase [Chloroflexota bacterium]